MTDQLVFEPFLRMIAHRHSWDVFLPQGGDRHEDDTPHPPEAEWLANFLQLWSSQVGAFVERVEGGRRSGVPSEDGDQVILQLLLESLANAAETLLVFKRTGHPIEVPERFSETAGALFSLAGELGLKGKDRTVAQIARRLSAADSRPRQSPRPVKVDDRGRVFELSGERVFGFEPEGILKSRQDIAAGRTHSLEAIREAERRDGA